MKKTLIIALGGNALLRRGQILSYENQLQNIQQLAISIKKLSHLYRIVIVHGNGPQVGLLLQQNETYTNVPSYPLSCLVAETQGMIATMLMQELRKEIEIPIVSILTHVEVSPEDSAFLAPTKFIGAVYNAEEARKLAQQYNWMLKPDGNYFRRVVSSPLPLDIQEKAIIQTALQQDHIVICCGGGGIPVARHQGNFINIDCVIDKDATASLLAQQIQADYFLILTDGDGIYLNWGTEYQQKLENVTIDELSRYQFDEGSMQPKVDAMISYLTQVHQGIGIIADLHLAQNAIEGKAGTRIFKN
ncbi:carbamate kinase [Avibacterium sp. 20-15]|uniref:carbamate kinase n=1 Tax=unclassified Avibacterium TaxID=2685287 RepID=UPI002026F1AA|nr:MULTISPECIES: carbamate kinase [unclassified Avibacterium]MCW9732948.1 carbamate kinase [Avibacterium sp. 20-15]URL05082.1 carbamate kinase [Avibacterium sp. 20-132]